MTKHKMSETSTWNDKDESIKIHADAYVRSTKYMEKYCEIEQYAIKAREYRRRWWNK